MIDQSSTVNARGDKLSDRDFETLYGKHSYFGTWSGGEFDPAKMSEVLNNWLTAGGPPKPLDPGEIFGKAQALSGVEARGAAGQGIAGLFGFGNRIGSMAPMASGVPYSATPAPKVSLNPLFNPAYGGKFGGK